MTFRGVRRLDAALSKDPLKDYDEAVNAYGARTKSAKEKILTACRQAALIFCIKLRLTVRAILSIKKARVPLTLPSRTPKKVTFTSNSPTM
ncbi:MAG: hypothetical protein IKW80_02315 [Thermoguttaceae bacterium]|nr:hypothetical protein [Thermoguttaceae bacterium]